MVEDLGVVAQDIMEALALKEGLVMAEDLGVVAQEIMEARDLKEGLVMAEDLGVVAQEMMEALATVVVEAKLSGQRRPFTQQESLQSSTAQLGFLTAPIAPPYSRRILS